ncbi:hypothetical protein PP636_gp34 [Arthrobacter phage Hestia]|uniref:Uncharacterized protein n=1 Tax=Arthrobacter phage Hestia TaxID=2419609 RepID=A0A3G3M3E9_9CAUD|nr:hypothetical protein PP636_gp34 [Arthrobacter phage Hestia]AYR00939.1 hypothetical protein PBI_HESTIA_61 [Arthrobacter phage Hestia]
MDLTESIAPKSDQLDAVDLVSGPRTFTIERVSKGNPDQPFNFHLAEFPRVWRPGKSMRRVIVSAWGANSENYAGKQVTLYCDPSVQFGGEAVGGTRISHMSGIDKPLKVPLLVKRGKSAIFTVQPLPESPPAVSEPTIPDDVVATTQQAAADGKAAEYLAWLTDQGAPSHILDYVRNQAGAPHE